MKKINIGGIDYNTAAKFENKTVKVISVSGSANQTAKIEYINGATQLIGTDQLTLTEFTEPMSEATKGGLPTHEELYELKPYKEFPNKDYYNGYKAGMPEGGKYVLNRAQRVVDGLVKEIRELQIDRSNIITDKNQKLADAFNQIDDQSALIEKLAEAIRKTLKSKGYDYHTLEQALQLHFDYLTNKNKKI